IAARQCCSWRLAQPASLSRRSLGSVARPWFLFELEANFELTRFEPGIPAASSLARHAMAAPADHASIPSPFREPRALMGTGPTPSWPTTANAAFSAHKQPSVVDSLARPGGNATGFMSFEYSISGKWLELLKEIAPRVTRVAVIRDPTATGTVGQLGAIQSVAPSLGVELKSIDARDAGEIERGVTTFGRGSNGGLIVTSSRLAVLHRDLIIALAGQHRLPAVYPYRVYATGGGLIFS